MTARPTVCSALFTLVLWGLGVPLAAGTARGAGAVSQAAGKSSPAVLAFLAGLPLFGDGFEGGAVCLPTWAVWEGADCPPCNVTSCPDGCCNGNICTTPTFASACGTSGIACTACAPGTANQCGPNGCACGLGPACASGQECVGVGAAATCQCNATTCPDGCCDGNVCRTSQAASCGVGGAQCQPCGAGADSCAAGVCQCSGQPACAGDLVCLAGACVPPPPTVVATTPAPGSTPLADSAIAVTFSLPMNPASLTAQTTAGPCTGSLQVSRNEFASCLGFATAAPAMSAGDTVATLRPAPGMPVRRSHRIRVTTAATSAGGVSLASTYTSAAFTTTCSAQLTISQVYGGGGLPVGTTYDRDFVELHNGSSQPVSLDGLSIQYAASTGAVWSVQPLAGTIAGGGYFLIAMSDPGPAGPPLPTPDLVAVPAIAMTVNAGKVALVAGTLPGNASCPLADTVIDFVGYGTGTNCSEGGSPAPAPSAAGSVQRNENGCADSDSNASDFTQMVAAARNAGAPPVLCTCRVRNEEGVAEEADACNVWSPPAITATAGTAGVNVQGRVTEAGVTGSPGPPLTPMRMQMGFGPANRNPQYETGWQWGVAGFNADAGAADQFQRAFTVPAAGTYRYAFRVTFDMGRTWTYCDRFGGADDGAGSGAGLTFDLEDLPVLISLP